MFAGSLSKHIAVEKSRHGNDDPGDLERVADSKDGAMRQIELPRSRNARLQGRTCRALRAGDGEGHRFVDRNR